MEGGQRTTSSLIDRQDVLIATMLTRFSQLIKIAMEPEDENATLENQAANSLQLEVELQALVKTTEDLLKLSRELKELWLAGPLRGIAEGEGDGDMAKNAKKVQELVDRITKMVRENGVGSDGRFH